MTNMKIDDKTSHNSPSIRFPEFTGEWKEERLSEIADIYKGAGISKDQLSDNGEPCILYGELYTKYKVSLFFIVLAYASGDPR